MPVEQREQVTRVEINRVNWQQEDPAGFGGRRQPLSGGTSRVNREVYARFCERLGVKLPGPTRRARRSLWAVPLSPTLPARYGAVSVSERFPGSTEFRGQGTGPDQPFESLRCVGPIGGRVIVFHPGAAFGLGIGCAGLGEDDFVFPGDLALGTLGLLALPRIGRRAIAVRIVRRNGA